MYSVNRLRITLVIFIYFWGGGTMYLIILVYWIPPKYFFNKWKGSMYFLIFDILKSLWYIYFLFYFLLFERDQCIFDDFGIPDPSKVLYIFLINERDQLYLLILMYRIPLKFCNTIILFLLSLFIYLFIFNSKVV